MKIAVMQPYLFPYIGYFQLINFVDHFVFYDDVNFIKQGWINRNKILVKGEEKYFTLPLDKPSSFKEIKEIMPHPVLFPKWRIKFLKTLYQSYKDAPYRDETYNLVEQILTDNEDNIGNIAIASIKAVTHFLGLNKKFYNSSVDFKESKGAFRADRLIQITKKLNGKVYVNPAGGMDLYKPEYFASHDIELQFFYSKIIPYHQGSSESFRPNLSIIDVLMYNSQKEVIRQFETEIKEYEKNSNS